MYIFYVNLVFDPSCRSKKSQATSVYVYFKNPSPKVCLCVCVCICFKPEELNYSKKNSNSLCHQQIPSEIETLC
jgi:hypothetical protein